MIGSVELAQLIQADLQSRNLGGYVVKPGPAPRIEQDDPDLSSGILAVVPVGDEFVRQTRRGSGISRIQVGVVLKKQRAPGSSESTDIGLATQKLRQVCSHLLTTPITAREVRAESFGIEPAFDEDQLDQHHIIHLQAVLVYQVPTNAPADILFSVASPETLQVTGTLAPDVTGKFTLLPDLINGYPAWANDDSSWFIFVFQSSNHWVLADSDEDGSINAWWFLDDTLAAGPGGTYTANVGTTGTATVTPEAP